MWVSSQQLIPAVPRKSSFWKWITAQIARITRVLRAQFVGAMDESSQPNKSLELNAHSRFIIGSVSEDNSEDETSSLVKLDLLEEKERSLSPVSVCSDSLSDLGLPNTQDGLASHMRYG
ncbi:hypothetical protein WISP_133843 [Willisornis vidua]|uniref:Uncharacterized protein n=1 Tax=Willisornis vidua TaxID=1566151 RepID=A0ABQ9CTL9_9PASS|nr:hypothetical protein WISP_133843 [Willisornis vidua]